MTTTTQPCFGCLKEMLQAGISEVRYLTLGSMEAYDDRALVQQYAALRARFDAFSRLAIRRWIRRNSSERFSSEADQAPVWSTSWTARARSRWRGYAP